VPIPDNQAAGVAATITVPEAFTIGDVRIEAALSHTFVGDLIVTISHGGRSATLLHRIGGGSTGDDSDLDGVYAFTDEAGMTVWDAAIVAPVSASVVPPAPYRAADQHANTVSLRGVFAGTPAAGPWTLTIADTAAFDTGVLNGWRLLLDRAAGDTCDPAAGACCAGVTCGLSTAAACSGPNRRFTAVGTACNAPGNAAAPCCRADFSQAGGVTIQDVFDYLGAFFAGSSAADFNGGGVSVQDIFDFLSAYFAGCP
jgi:subtilisin-like proprotein convertase family protein